MASPARINEVLPETLPEDFIEWDEASRSAKPVQSSSGEPRAEVGVVSNPAVQAPEAHRAAAPSRNLPREIASSVAAQRSTGCIAALHPPQSFGPPSHSSRGIVSQVQAAATAIDKFRSSMPRLNGVPAAAGTTALHGILLPSLRANVVEIARVVRKKWSVIAGASAALVVILAATIIPMADRRGIPSVKLAAAPAPSIGAIQQPKNAEATRANSTVRVSKSTAAGAAHISSEATPQRVQKNAKPSSGPATSMDNQLHTPTQLQIKAALAGQTSLSAGSFAATDIQGLDNSNPIEAAFGPKEATGQSLAQKVIRPKQAKEQIAPQQAINVPTSVALGLLIEKRQPVYPLIAKAAQVSGTISLAATISKTGKVEDLRVMSGPGMFRTSAVEAVRTWRFKPYMLNGQPIAIETTINLHFSIN